MRVTPATTRLLHAPSVTPSRLTWTSMTGRCGEKDDRGRPDPLRWPRLNWPRWTHRWTSPAPYTPMTAPP